MYFPLILLANFLNVKARSIWFYYIYEMLIIVLTPQIVNSVMRNLGDLSYFNLARDQGKHIFSQTEILFNELRRTNVGGTFVLKMYL